MNYSKKNNLMNIYQQTSRKRKKRKRKCCRVCLEKHITREEQNCRDGYVTGAVEKLIFSQHILKTHLTLCKPAIHKSRRHLPATSGAHTWFCAMTHWMNSLGSES